MTTNRDVFNTLCELAPLSLQMGFDNAGFQLGHLDAPVSRVLLALDVTDAVVQEAAELGAELIVSHHPLIFHPVKSLSDGDPATARLLRLAEQRIAVISMHTNLDIVDGGVNDVLMRLLGAETEGALDADGCGRIGRLPAALTMEAFLALCAERLGGHGLRYVDAGRPVQRIAVMGGSGGDAVEQAFRLGCDTYLTADVKYHEFQRAAELGVNLIDGDHFCTENPVIADLQNRLSARLPELSVVCSQRHGQLIRFA